jgi:hypothetical protein
VSGLSFFIPFACFGFWLSRTDDQMANRQHRSARAESKNEEWRPAKSKLEALPSHSVRVSSLTLRKLQAYCRDCKKGLFASTNWNRVWNFPCNLSVCRGGKIYEGDDA